MFSTDSQCFPLSFSSSEKTKMSFGCHVGITNGLKDQWGPTPGQITDDDEGRMAGCIIVVEIYRDFDVTPNADFAHTCLICRSSVTIPCTANVDMFKAPEIYWMIERGSERKTSRIRFTVRRLRPLSRKGSSVIFFRPFLNAFCHLPFCVLNKQSSLSAS